MLFWFEICDLRTLFGLEICGDFFEAKVLVRAFWGSAKRITLLCREQKGFLGVTFWAVGLFGVGLFLAW